MFFSSKMVNTAQQVKETLLMGTMNIGLPTFDVYTDGALLHQLYRGYPFHPNCTAMQPSAKVLPNWVSAD